MKKHLVKGLVACATWSVLVLGLLGDASPSWAQDSHGPGSSLPSASSALDNGVEQTLHTLAEYANGNSTVATQMLEKQGFQVPAGKAAEWRNMPDSRKFYYAWSQARAVSAANGDELMARLSRDMAMRYAASGQESSLARYRNLPVGTAPLRFKNVSVNGSSVAVKALPDDLVRAVSTLGNYSSGGAGDSGAHRALTRHFGMSDTDADRLLLSSDSTSDAFLDAMKKHPPGKQRAIVRAMAADLGGRYDALKYEPALAHFMDDSRVPPQAPRSDGPPSRGPPAEHSPTGVDGPDRRGGDGSSGNDSRRGSRSGSRVDDSGHSSGSPGSTSRPPPSPPPSVDAGGGQRPGHPAGSAYSKQRTARYDNYVKRNYSKPGSRRFVRMSRGRAGFGGVVFGNEVQKERSMRAPSRVSFSDDHLEITLRGGQKLHYGPISTEAARLGYALSHGSVHPVQKGEGIGLVGVQRVPIVRCDAATRMVTTSSSAPFEVIMHPALFDSLAGWASIRVDIAMSDPRDLIQRLQHHGGMEAQRQLVELHQRMGRVAVGTWKVVDVPMQIGRDGDRLTVMRASETGVRDHDSSLRKRAFIELRPVVEAQDQDAAARRLGGEPLADYDRESARMFYQLVPRLIEASPDFQRINELAAVLAIYRWAKEHRAKVSRPEVDHEQTATPPAVYIDRGVVHPLSEQWVEGVRKDGKNALIKCMEGLADKNATLKEIAEKYQIALLVGIQAAETLESLRAQGKGNTQEAREAEDTIEKVRTAWSEGPKIAQSQNDHDLVYWFELMEFIMSL